MKMDYEHFWKYHNKSNMDIHAVKLIEKQNERIIELEAALQEIVVESGDIEKSKWPTQQQKCFAIAQQALKG